MIFTKTLQESGVRTMTSYLPSISISLLLACSAWFVLHTYLRKRMLHYENIRLKNKNEELEAQIKNIKDVHETNSSNLYITV